MTTRLTIIIVFFLSVVLTGFFTRSVDDGVPAVSAKLEIRGIYGSPSAFWRKGLDLRSLGINSIFMHHGSIDDSIMRRAKSEGIMVFAEFATLNGKNYVEKYPEAWAIDNHGKKVEAATWFMGVCPTEPGFREFRRTELRKLLRRFDIGGVWMDYLHWHAQFEDPKPILPETCFCENCLSRFQSASNIQVPSGTTAHKADWILRNQDSAWRHWRCTVIADWVRDFRMIINQEKPGALLGVYHCPWDDREFDSARRRILGLDYDMLRGIVDVFSPMVYHGRMERSPEWVKENIDWFCKRLNIREGVYPKVWPIVQAHNDPGIISAEEFEKVLRYGSGSKASGVMMFTSNSVAEDAAKTAVMRKVYKASAQ